MITRKFLESKTKSNDYYNNGGGGNVYKIADNMFQFNIYNYLPGENPYGLDGHYSFIVDITNFNYIVYKDSGYGGLTWVRDIENKVFLDIHESIKEEVESTIASKLLGAYYYDPKYSNSEGMNLFPDDTPNKDWGFCLTCPHGPKISLICTWVDDYPNEPLGELKDIEKLAIETLLNLRK